MTSKWLYTATSAMSAGDKRRALALLRAYLLQHPSDEEGWYWLDQLSERPDYETALLQSLLVGDPYRFRKSRANHNTACKWLVIAAARYIPVPSWNALKASPGR